MTHRPISRRQLLRGAGVAIALPALDAMHPSISLGAAGAQEKPYRMLAVCNNLGLLPGDFFPTSSGSEYALSPYLQELKDHRANFTVFSGVSHPDVDGGHPADNCFLTAAPHPGRGGFRNTVSLDQVIAEHYGHQTRFPSLTLGVNVAAGQRSLSWTAGGVLIPCQQNASLLFGQLFLEGDAEEKENRLRRLSQGGSVLDAVAEQSRDFARNLPSSDQSRLDQYFTGVRELERRMTKAREWESRPKPTVSSTTPIDPANPAAFMEKTRLMYRMAKLALETDSTRSITLMLDGVSTPTLQVDGRPTSSAYHNLSHHGKRDEKIAELRRIDRWHMKLLNELLTSLQTSRDDEQSLLDSTMVLYGSNLGDANKHSTTNLPVILAGGNFNHGRHLAFDQADNYPLPNLFVSMLQRIGIETDEFASSTGTMAGFDMRR